MPKAMTKNQLTQATLLEVCEREFGLPPDRAITQLKRAVKALDPSSSPDFDFARIRKIKLTKSERTGKDRIRIDYLLPTGDLDWKECSQTDKAEDLTSEFHQALKDLVPHAMQVLELDKDYGENTRVTGVSISYADDDNATMTVTLTLQKELTETNSPFVFNTPAKPCNPYSGGTDDSNCLSANMVKAIHVVLDETRAYLGGERKTLQLSIESLEDE